MLTSEKVVKRLKKDLKESNRNLGKQRDNIRKCRAFIAGDYMEYTDKIQFATMTGQKKRVTVQINKITPYLDAVTGFFAQNRRKPNYIARMQKSMAQQIKSKYTNALSEYMRRRMNADQVETQQDGDMLGCGLGVTETAMSYGDGYASTNPNGEAQMECVDIDTYWWDSAARQTGLLDRRYDGVTKRYHVEEALKLFKGSEEEDFEAPGTTEARTSYEYQGDIGSYDRIKYDWADKKEGMVNVHFYQYYDIEEFFRADNPCAALKNPESVQRAQMELQAIAQEVADTDEDFDPAADILSFNSETKELLDAAFGEFIQPESFNRKVFYTCIASGEKCFKHVKSEDQKGFTRKVKTGKYDPKNKIWIGMVNSMMEPQKYYNKALTELIFIIAANSKGGVLVEEDAVEDIEEFEDEYAKTDAVILVRPGALSGPGGPKLKDKRQPFQPTGYELIVQMADQAIPDAGGVDRTFLFSAENPNDTAQFHRQRIRQVVAVLACYADSISLCQLEHARLMQTFMRIFAQNNRGGMFHIMGQGGVDFVQISEDHLADEYDVIIEEAPVTPEERQDTADRLNNMADKLAAVGDVQTAKQLYALAARYMAMDSDDVQSITEILTPQEQQVSPQQVQMLMQKIQLYESAMTQAQLEKVKAETAKLESDAALNQAKIPDLRAGVSKKAAETAHTLEEAHGKNLETKIIKAHPRQASFLHAPQLPKPAGEGKSA